MSLLFNMLSSLVIVSVPRSKYLLISWLQSPSAVILEPKKIKSVTVSTISPSICHDYPSRDPCYCSAATSNFLWPHGLQHTRLLCPPLSPRVHSVSCPLSWWCHPTVSSSVVPFFSCLQSFPASGSFLMSQFLHIRWPMHWSFSFSISPSSEYSGLISFRIDQFDLLLSKGLSRVFSSITIWKHQFFGTQPSLWSNSHMRTWLLEKNHSFD